MSSKFSGYIFYVRTSFKQIVWIEKKVEPILEPDAKMIIFEAPFMSYPEIQLNKNFKVYFNSVLK